MRASVRSGFPSGCSSIMGGMNRLSTERRAQILGALVEGNSIRATGRMTGAAKNTIAKLLVDIGEACSAYQDQTLRDLPCKAVEVGEIWNYCYAKQKNVPEQFKGTPGYGDVWTFTAICADTKLVPTWLVGERTPEDAVAFLEDLAARMRGRIQLTTSNDRIYAETVREAFEHRGDWAPYAQRQKLTMRMGMRRFTRLTNGFSRKAENLTHAVALHFMYYNFARTHQSLQGTPAMAAGVTDHLWSLEEIAALLD
jgi:IS1 family transposase